MKIGARVFKTGLAITLAICISMMITKGDGILAGLAAVYSTQPSVRKSYELFFQRVVSNIVGGIIAVVVTAFLGSSPLAIGFISILLIATLNTLNLENYIGLALGTVIVLTARGDEQAVTITRAVLRVGDTLIGVSVSFLINWLIYPPHYDAKMFTVIDQVSTEVIIWIRAFVRKNTDFTVLASDIKWAQKQMNYFNQLFELTRNEMILTKSKRIGLARKLVIYRYLGETTQSAIELLNVLHENNFVFDDFPDNLRIMIRHRLETLLAAHEQILMKFSGRVDPDEVNFIDMNVSSHKTYMKEFFDVAHEHEDDLTKGKGFMYNTESHRVIHIMSAIYKYEENLSTLNRLMRNFKSKQITKDLDLQLDDHYIY